MIVRRLSEMTGGWIVGDFEPACFRTTTCEVACRHYDAGSIEAARVHQLATEITVIASGCVEMNGRIFGAGDIVVLAPGEAADFRAIEQTTTVLFKSALKRALSESPGAATAPVAT